MNLKELIEKRNALITSIEAVVNKATEEKRAMTDEENTKYETDMKEISALGKTIDAAIATRALAKMDDPAAQKKEESPEVLEARAFDALIRGKIEQRDATNLTKSDNGTIIPQTIVKKIITEITEICPIMRLATVYNIKGKILIPKYGANSDVDFTMAWADEFTALASNAGAFTNVELGGFLAGGLCKISKSLINNSDFDVVGFIVSYIAKKATEFIEKECIVGTSEKTVGVLSATSTATTTSTTAITADELIGLTFKVKAPYQKNACWIMNSSTLEAIRKLKDGEGRYLLNMDINGAFGTTLLGKPVYPTDSMPAIEASAKTVVYGDLSCLALKIGEMTVQVLNEKYADEHAVGALCWIEMDCDIQDEQGLAVLVQKS